MRQLTPQEQRTVRIAGIAIGVYLVLFCGFLIYKRLAGVRSDYRRLVAEASDLRQEIRPYQDKAEHAKKLMEGFRLDPMTLAATSLVAQASAAMPRITGDPDLAQPLPGRPPDLRSIAKTGCVFRERCPLALVGDDEAVEIELEAVLNRGAVDLRHAKIRRGMDHLPLQVGKRDHVVVDDPERPHSGGGKVEQHRCAEPAGTDH